MLLLLAVLLVLEALLLPVTLEADWHHGASRLTRITAKYAIFTHTWIHGEQSPGAKRRQRGRRLLAAMRQADHARAFLLRHIRLEQLDARILLCTGNAARTSLVTGSLWGLLECIPQLHRRNVHIRVLPDFFRPHSTVQVRCIIRLTMGTILLTMLVLLAFRLRQKARTAYGTSHW